MEAVVEDKEWNLYCPSEPGVVKATMDAKDLWKKILTSYFESGSPFLCFKDTANRTNPNPHVPYRNPDIRSLSRLRRSESAGLDLRCIP